MKRDKLLSDLHIHVTKEELARLQAIAAKDQVSATIVVRRMIRACLLAPAEKWEGTTWRL